MSLDQIKECLEKLLPRENCVLTFDRSLVEQLPDILRENFGITSALEASRLPTLERLFNLLLPNRKHEWDIMLLPKLIEAAGIDLRDYVPRPPATVMDDYEKNFSKWSLTTANENINNVLILQRDLGMGQHNPASERYPASWEGENFPLRLYMFGVTTLQPSFFERLTRRSFWQLWIAWWKMRGMLNSKLPSLSIGPRWVTEIKFFREIVGLKRHVGLDLFSDDSDLVKVGDMHRMPFPDRHFQLIFIKNTTDKSYDIRQLTSELIRVTLPGGIIIVDQICGYGDCSPLTRTDIQKSDNLLRLFRACSPVTVLVQRDVSLVKAHAEKVRDRSSNSVRLAIRLPI